MLKGIKIRNIKSKVEIKSKLIYTVVAKCDVRRGLVWGLFLMIKYFVFLNTLHMREEQRI